MKTFFIRSLVAALCLGSAVANANGSISGLTITRMYADNNGKTIVYFSAGVGGTPPGCATQTTGWGIDGTTTAGKALLSVAMTFFVTGKTVSGSGAGTCNVIGSYEDASVLYSN
jgi:hypothetical protein